MYQGKKTCETLKAIRKQIADANDIPYEPVKCTHEGDCLGTCPACESEVRYIEDQLNIRKMAGKAVKIIGLASVVSLAASAAASNETSFCNSGIKADTLLIKVNIEEAVTGKMTQSYLEFPGGEEAMMVFIKDNIVYPEVAREAGIQGRVIVQFIVGTDGTISDIEVVRGVHPLLDEEAMRVVGKMPKWKPGKLMDKTVRTKYSLPVFFKLSEEEMNNKVDGMISPIVSPALKK
ncbi:MAG: energy transducer TonB [Bacteroidales bacterium]|nr:energy transducer TonB [Candidatus Scybalocola fimicaballi]